MQRCTLLSVAAALALATACSDTTTAPTVPLFDKPQPGSGAHFQSTGATVNDDGTLTVSFDEAGLGTSNITVRATADANALYACQNGGGNFPSDPKKQSRNARVEADGTFTPDHGRATGTLTLSPPPSNLRCPAGQSPVLVSVTYTNVTVTDVSNSVSESIPGTFSKTFFTI